MAFQPATLPSRDLLDEQLHSAFALNLLTQVAKSLTADAFNESMTCIFGQDIPQRIYAALRERLLAGQIENPSIVISQGSYIADYDNRQRVIRIHTAIVSEALTHQGSIELLDVLFHEFGHHLDNILRNDFSDHMPADMLPLKPDAKGEEGVRFSFWMAWLGRSDDCRLPIASYRYLPWDQGFDIDVDWHAGHKAIMKRHNDNLGQVEHQHIHPDREAFEAGDGDGSKLTHLQIEAVLRETELLAEERETIYFGNWLRDYSQLLDPKIVRATTMPKNFPDVLSREALTRIVDILSIKRFSKLRQRDPAAYTVTPQILGVYRPSEHIDNPRTTDLNAPDPTTRDADFEPAVLPGDPLLEVDYATSMKRYIARSLAFMENELQIAMRSPFSTSGLRAFGSALHVLEDFFAHSNFVELALIKNGHSAVLPWTSPADCKAGLPLVTGMFGSTDVLASLSGPLGDILFSTEDVTYKPVKAGDRSPREQILLILLEEHHNPRFLEIFEAYLTTRDTWVDLPFVEFLQRCAAYLQGLSAVPGNAVGIVMKDVLTQFGENVDDWQTRYGQDPHENGSTDPTHSQLAKDHAEHPLHMPAGSLAAVAVKDVATAMVSYWNKGFGADPIAVARSYFTHPQDSHWQDAQIQAWAVANPGKLSRAESKTELLNIHRQLAQTSSKVLEQMRKDSVAYLKFMRGELVDRDSPLWFIAALTPTGNLSLEVLAYLNSRQ
jgi:hypothetical protein